MTSDGEQPFDWNPPAAAEPPAAPEPPARSRRPRPALLGAAVAAVAAAIVAIVLATGGGGGSQSFRLAAYATAHQAGYRYDLSMNIALGGVSFAVKGAGAINTGPPASGSLTMSLGTHSIDELFVGHDLYIQSPTSSTSWWMVDLGPYLDNPLAGGGTLSETDPRAMLSFLRAAGSVTDAGPATVDGTATTHYQADVNLSQLAALVPASQRAALAGAESKLAKLTGSGTLPLDVWIDGSNLVRRIQMAIPVHTSVVSAKLTMAMDFFDYGAQSAVTPPPASEVTTLPSLSQLPQSLSQLAG